jgi:hypothetical protein
MQEFIENIIATVVVLAVLARLGRSIFKAFQVRQTTPVHVCSGGCASCKMCGQEGRLFPSKVSEVKNLTGKPPV